VIDESEVDRAARLTHAEFGLGMLSLGAGAMQPLG
jgi:hypothetical protein